MCEKCIAYQNLIISFGSDKKAVIVYEKELEKVHKQ